MDTMSNLNLILNTELPYEAANEITMSLATLQTQSTPTTPQQSYSQLQPQSDSQTQIQAQAQPPSSAVSPATSMADGPTPSNNYSTSVASTPTNKVTRNKDKLKHSESENRRRTRLRQKFSILRETSQCMKKDRFNILNTAIMKIQDYEQRLMALEQDKQTLLSQLTSLSNNPNGTVAPSLSLSLCSYPMLNNLAACYIALDGRIIDANYCFYQLFDFTKDDIYKSSLFAITHHSELMNMLNVMRNLLCGVGETVEMVKKCVDMKGRILDAHITITAITKNTKILMFLCLFVPKDITRSVENASNSTASFSMEHATPIEVNTAATPTSNNAGNAYSLQSPHTSGFMSPNMSDTNMFSSPIAGANNVAPIPSSSVTTATVVSTTVNAPVTSTMTTNSSMSVDSVPPPGPAPINETPISVPDPTSTATATAKKPTFLSLDKGFDKHFLNIPVSTPNVPSPILPFSSYNFPVTPPSTPTKDKLDITIDPHALPTGNANGTPFNTPMNTFVIGTPPGAGTGAGAGTNPFLTYTNEELQNATAFAFPSTHFV